jgi:hypothetical protein
MGFIWGFVKQLRDGKCGISGARDHQAGRFY